MKTQKRKTHALRFLVLFGLVAVLSVFAQCSPEKKDSGEISYYTCSMHPQVISQEPGQCPICGMDLTPVKKEAKDGKGEKKSPDGSMVAGEHGAHSHPESDKTTEESVAENPATRFRLSAAVIRNANIATVAARREKFTVEKKFSAHFDFNEGPDSLVIVSPKYDGWAEKILVSKEGQYVKKGQALIGFYSPTILAAKEEYLTTFQSVKEMYLASGKPKKEIWQDPTVKAARKKLELLDVSDWQISKLEKEESASRHTYYHSPISGVITKKNITRGQHVKAGQEVMRVANLSRLWAYFHIFEKDLSWVKKGLPVEIRTRAFPDKKFSGKVDLVYPFLNRETRDVRVRVVINNYDYRLKPGMFAEVNLRYELDEENLIVPDSGVIFSGAQTYVFVSVGGGSFEARPVVLRLSSDGQAVLREGLKEGDQVVVNSQFLLDSEASLRQSLDMEKAADTGTPKGSGPAGNMGETQ